jgi:hypothetical protein
MIAKDLCKADTFAQQTAMTMLRSPMQECARYGRPESPSTYMMDLDLDDASGSEEEAKRGCLILCCTDCLSAVLIEYSNGSIPGLPRLTNTSPRCNGVALTDCSNCFARTRKGLEGRGNGNGGQFRMTRTTSMCPSLWDASDLTKAAALVLEEEVSLMLVGRIRLHLSWDRVSRAITARDRITSLDISQVDTGDARKIVLSHLADNWI